MSFSSWLRSSNHSAPAARRRNQRTGFSPRPEALEDRLLLSASASPTAYLQTNLVGYKAGIAQSTDTNLNGWGMASLPNGEFVVANAFTTGKATFYDASGHVLPQTITVPGSATGSAALGLGSGGHPTGVVYNPTSNFVISEGHKSAPALLIFDSIDGTISGWNPAVDPNHAILIKDTFAAGTPAVFTSLAMAQNSRGQTILYATDYLNNRVDMFDSHFNLIGSFTDPNVTKVDSNLSAWSVQAEGGKLYVTFADLHNFDAGAVDEFNTDGQLLRQFAANGPDAGPLENPWGVAQAPANFGTYSGDLLIGNVAGAGNINVFNPHTGAYLGQLDQPDGAPIAITGLWDLQFGDGTPWGGKTNELFFDAGPNAPGVAINGLFGDIQASGHPVGALASAAAVSSQPVVQEAVSTPSVENSGSVTGNTVPVGSAAEDIDNLDAVYVDSTRSLGNLDPATLLEV
jgi:uncharacterized protein (TIGR03118 family)